jgi:hypothetical protein
VDVQLGLGQAVQEAFVDGGGVVQGHLSIAHSNLLGF